MGLGFSWSDGMLQVRVKVSKLCEHTTEFNTLVGDIMKDINYTSNF